MLCVAAAVTASAVPAAPDSGHTGDDVSCRSHTGDLVALDDIPARRTTAGGKKAPSATVAPAPKNIPLAIIVVGFRNIPYENEYDWANTIFVQNKSLKAYYKDMSFGQFSFEPVKETSAYKVGGNTNRKDTVNDGIVHVTLNHDHQEWIGLADADEVQSLTETLIAAIEQAGAYIDFAAYDADGNGEITANELAVAFVLAGYEASYTSAYTLDRDVYLWSHAWSVDEAIEGYGFDLEMPAPGGATVSAYIAIAEKLDTSAQEPISVLAHELGHYLGLPDLYDTAYHSRAAWSGYEVYSMSVMALGAWGIDPDGGYLPYSLDVWSRYMLGWLSPEEVDESGQYTVASQDYSAAGGSFSVLKIPTQHSGEYYLLENRQYTKWDAGMAQDYKSAVNGGLVLWHIDDGVYARYRAENAVNNADHRPAIMPLYPETDHEAVSFIGTYVDTRQPFFDAAQWSKQYATLGTALDLPLYGAGKAANSRGERSLSGIQLTFLTDSAPVMSVQINIGTHKHVTTLITRTEADCDLPGIAAHWRCDYCGLLFADADGVETLTAKETVLPPLGHTDPDAEGDCTRCGTHLVDVDAHSSVLHICRYCGKDHGTSIYGRLVHFFHNLMYSLRRVFA